jgi:hypothetical protein
MGTDTVLEAIRTLAETAQAESRGDSGYLNEARNIIERYLKASPSDAERRSLLRELTRRRAGQPSVGRTIYDAAIRGL